MRTNTLFSLAICGFLSLPGNAMQAADTIKRSDAMGPHELRLLTLFLAIPAAYIAGTFAHSLTDPYAQRGIYLTCNENDQATTLERMRELQARGTVGIGTSGLFNLNLFLARYHRGVQHWVMVDPAPEVQNFWRTFQEIFRKAIDLDHAFQLLEEAMMNEPSDYFTDNFLRARNARDVQSYRKWLAGKLSQARAELRNAQGEMPFETLKELVTEHLILMPTDLTSRDEVRRLAEYLAARNARIDTLYVSNINTALGEDWLTYFRSCTGNLRWQSGCAKPAYLVEAGPSTFGENARALATETYQRIYEDWQVE